MLKVWQYSVGTEFLMLISCYGSIGCNTGSAWSGLRPVVSLIEGVNLEESGDGSNNFYVPYKTE